MSPTILFSVVLVYFIILLIVAYYTSRNSNNDSFFIGNKSSNWMLVAFGMIGTSLSGVTFVSVPGTVDPAAFAYFQVVIGYFIGYLIIAYVLLPLYYRLNLTSIYNYLLQRFGIVSYKTGALFFIISRTLGATARLYLVINVLQIFILDRMGVPFSVTTLTILAMIMLYTFRGGVKTIVWTDTLQTTCMLVGLIVCVIYIMNSLGLSFGDTMSALDAKGFTKIFNMDANSPGFFVKQIIGGAFITVAMTGLDQEMMQKNISVRTLKDSQKNMVSFSIIIVFVNFLFLFLGGLLYLYAASQNITTKGDDLFPTIALGHLPEVIGVIFIVGLISALFPSADGAITALTSSFCIDILGLKRRNIIAVKPGEVKDKLNELEEGNDPKSVRTRQTVHIIFAVVFMICVMIFKFIDNKSIINVILKVAGYTYGPLLGLFAFGMLTKRKLFELMVPVVCLASPGLCYVIESFQADIFGSYKIGIELLILNAAITFIGLYVISRKNLEHKAL